MQARSFEQPKQGGRAHDPSHDLTAFRASRLSQRGGAAQRNNDTSLPEQALSTLTTTSRSPSRPPEHKGGEEGRRDESLKRAFEGAGHAPLDQTGTRRGWLPCPSQPERACRGTPAAAARLGHQARLGCHFKRSTSQADLVLARISFTRQDSLRELLPRLVSDWKRRRGAMSFDSKRSLTSRTEKHAPNDGLLGFPTYIVV